MPPAGGRLVAHLAALTGCRDREALDHALVVAVADLLPVQSAALYRPVGDANTSRWMCCAQAGPQALADLAVDNGPPVQHWPDLAHLPLIGEFPERQACLQTGQAVTWAGPPAGACFAIGGQRQEGSVLELRGLQALGAGHLAQADSVLRIFRNVLGLLDYSERDTLTGLLNRKTFDGSFLRHALPAALPAAGSAPAQAEARRPIPAGSAWLAVVDIDHFKRVNDRFGHLIGDEVLLLLAHLMRNTFRAQDLLYRFGGEEFVVLMRCRSDAEAALAFERLRSQVEMHAFTQVGRITVSIGFTQLARGDSPAAAFERADKALYVAKQGGRNQVADHAALVASGRLSQQARNSDVELF